MRIALLTAGTRGDVQPFVALARGLAAAGMRPVLAAPRDAEALVTAHGVEYARLRADYQEMIESEEGRAMLANPLRAFAFMRRTVFPLMRGLLDDAWAAARGADVVVFHPKVLGGADIAERLGVPAVVATPVPILAPTAAFPAAGVAARDLGAMGNRLTYAAVRGMAIPFHGVLSAWRREVLDLPPRSRWAHPYRVRGAPLPVLHAFSRHVVPPPPDWPTNALATGFWLLDGAAEWTPPPNLAEFLDAGPPPVYVGFGSMAARDPARTTRTVLDAVRLAGVRAVLATGWGGLDPGAVPESVFVLGSAPHAWLFPRVAAVVHHGGAGTTAEGLRAGRPTVICPFFGDQPFWGARVHALGAGPAPLTQKRLTPESLAAAIRTAVSDDRMRRRAEVLGEALRAESGVANAIEAIRTLASREGEQPAAGPA